MRKYKYIITLVLSLCANSLAAQSHTSGVIKNMPDFFETVKGQMQFPLAWRNAQTEDFGQWRADARKTLFSCMGQLPMATDTFEYDVVSQEQREGYQARKIIFNLNSLYNVSALLLIPDGKGPFPALIALHDHGACFSIGKEKMIMPIKGSCTQEIVNQASDWSTKCYDGVFTGDYYARNGYVVLSIDALLWGERTSSDSANVYDIQQALSANLLQLGMNWCGIITWDDIQSAEFLASLPFVDKDRIGAYGHSMGGHRAWMLSAASDRIKAAAAICWMNTTEYLMTLDNNQNKGASAYSMILPDIRRYLDYPDVASIACPKPMYFISGDHDKLFPLQGTQNAFSIIRDVWNSRNASSQLKTEIWDSPHYFNKQMQLSVLNFFNQWLKPNNQNPKSAKEFHNTTTTTDVYRPVREE